MRRNVYHKDMKRLIPFLMLAPVLGFGQASAQKKATVAPALGRWPIEGLKVEGNHSYTVEQVLAITALKVGQVVGRPEFDAARDRLIASGAFDTVSYRFQPEVGTRGYIATFTVTEIEQVYPVRFDDLHVSERDLTATLKAKDPLFADGKLPATQPVFQRYAKWVQEYLAAKGITEKVIGAVVPDRPGEFVISFHPDRPLPVVALIYFKGNVVVPQAKLQDAIQGVGVGMPYTEDRFREALNASVRPVYEARGRVRVSFPTIKTEPNKDIAGLNVTVTVDEGEVFKLGKVDIDGPTPLPAEELLSAGEFKTGDIADFDKVNDGLDRMKKALRHAGYMNAAITSRRAVDDDKRIVALTLWVEAGTQFTMKKLTIVGLDLDGEAEINRIWTMKPGKPFNPDYPDMFLKTIKEEGLFDNLSKTKADVKIDDKAHTADVTLTFTGGAPPPATKGRGGRGRGGN
jgi:outer membrane protein insertion porin family